jgi:DNA (cytosine-5)-methyltransferase 1
MLSADQWTISPAGLMVPASMPPRYDQPVGIDLFAGCGGFSLGFHQAGYHMVAAVEYDVNAALTYLVNLARPGVRIHFDTPEREKQFTAAVERHLGLKGGNGNAMSASAPRGQKGAVIQSGLLAGDGWISGQPASERGCEHFWVADVRNLTGAQILAELGLKRGEVDAVCGGPPCQGFSVANSKRNVMDPRNSLVFDFARLCLEIWPKAFVMENVPAIANMLTPEGVPVIDALARVMSDGGFSAYDALKASMHASAGTGGALRRDNPRPSKRKQKQPVPDVEPQMEALF